MFKHGDKVKIMQTEIVGLIVGAGTYDIGTGVRQCWLVELYSGASTGGQYVEDKNRRGFYNTIVPCDAESIELIK